MGAKPSTQQPIRPRSDTFPHGSNSVGAATSNGGSSTPFHQSNGNGSAGPSQRHSSGSRVGLSSNGNSAEVAAAVRRLRSMSAVEALTSSHSHRHHNRSTLSGSDSEDSSPETENNPNYAVLRMPGSLPLRLFQLTGIKCPVCNKKIASDNVEIHLVECLTKPRIIYNEEVLIELKGECIICFDDMTHGQTIARLPCLCIYHKRCIDLWFRVNRSCPEHPGD